MKFNLKKLRLAHNLTQTEFGSMLCMGLRNYQRCEAAEELPDQPAKILALIISINVIDGYNYIKSDCRNWVLNKSLVNEAIKGAAKMLEEG